MKIKIHIQKDVCFLFLLLVALIIMKLTGFVSWSWFWVLSPLLLPLIIGAGFFIGLIIAAFVYHVYLKRKKRSDHGKV